MARNNHPQPISLQTQAVLTALQLPRFGDASARKMINTFPNLDPQNVLDSAAKIVPTVESLSPDSIINAEQSAMALLNKCAEYDIMVISQYDPDYPPLLATILDAPPVLYVKGNPGALTSPGLAVVGTRKASETGKEIAFRVSGVLADNGFVVTSGLALGIDTFAHKGALANKGVTVAVMAHGLDTIAPSSNRGLAESILDSNGTLVSEYPPGFPARPKQFALRNRIQSGLSLGSVIVETGEVGGTIHQAKFTHDQGRRVLVAFAPKTYSDFNDRGGQLILEKYGATPIRSSADFFSVLKEIKTGNPDIKPTPATLVQGTFDW